MQFGLKIISRTQRDMLRDAQATEDIEEIGSSLEQVAEDDDITSNKEQIHPAWKKVFEKHQAALQKELDADEYQQLVKVFSRQIKYDPPVHELNPTKKRITFLLGAGCSKPNPSGIPTVKELLPDLLERARRLDREELTKLAEFCKREKIDNVEDLLTAAHIGAYCSRNPSTLKLLDFLLKGVVAHPEMMMGRHMGYTNLTSVPLLQDTLQGLFGLLISRMLRAKPNEAHEAIANYVKQHRDAQIVTTNYDCCIDLALGNVRDRLEYGIEFSNVKVGRNAGSNTASSLIKLHGSLNWFYCDSCQDVQLIEIGRTAKYFIKDEVPYPVVASCHACGGQRRPLLVPPLAMKFDVPPPLNPLLKLATDAFERSDVVVVVGYSFAEADLYISRMLAKAMQRRPTQMLIVVDPDESVVERVRNKFDVSITSFDQKRIAKISGDCAKELPEFLSGKLHRKKGAAITHHNGHFVDSRRRPRPAPLRVKAA